MTICCSCLLIAVSDKQHQVWTLDSKQSRKSKIRAVPNIHFVFKLAPNSGLNSLFVFVWIVPSTKVQMVMVIKKETATQNRHA